MKKLDFYKLCGFVIIFSLAAPFISSYSEESETLEIEIKNTIGDRVGAYQTNLVIYQGYEETPILEKDLESNPELVVLPKDNRYKVEIYVNGMFSEVEYVDLKNKPEKLDITIPLSGGLKFNVFFEDGETPIEDATVIIKSQDGQQQRIGNTNENGDTMRYWLQSTVLQENYYIVDIYYEEFLLSSVSNIKIQPGVPQDQKIVVPIPDVVEDLIIFKLFNTEFEQILKNQGDYSVLLVGRNNLPLENPITGNQGEIYFSSIPSDIYSVSVLKDGIADPFWPETRIIISGNQNNFELIQKNPVEPKLEPVKEPVKEPVEEPVANPVEFVVYQPTAKNYKLSCNCVSFRLDGVQDFWLNDVQFELINTFTEKNIPITLGIISNSFGNDPYLMNIIVNNIKEDKIEIANHGLDSTPFTVFDEKKQNEILIKSTEKIYEKLNVSTKVFIPPENRFNEDTQKVLRNNGYTHLSASLLNDSPPFALKDENLYRFPAVATTGEYIPSQNRILGIPADKTFSEAMQGIENYGFAVISIHPQAFSIYEGGEYANKINSIQFKQLENLIDQINTHGIDIVPVGEVNQKILIVPSNNQKNLADPYSIPAWIKNNAGWWRDGHIDDNSFLLGIQFLIKEKILQIPPTTQGSGGSEIPEWIKDNAGWWAEGKISDDDFIYGVNYLVNQGIIIIEL